MEMINDHQGPQPKVLSQVDPQLSTLISGQENKGTSVSDQD